MNARSHTTATPTSAIPMTNRTVPAAAEDMPADARCKLEHLIDAVRMSARAANYLAADMLGARDGSGETRISENMAELLIYATGRAVSDAEEANAAFLDAAYSGRGQ